MSERGSFVTNYIYCDKCYEATRDILTHDGQGKYLCAVPIPMYGDGPRTAAGFGDDAHPRELPIIAGKIGGLYAGEEIHTMEELLAELGPRLCPGHEVVVAVIPDSAEPVFLSAKHQKRESAENFNPQR
jgi:hypothetical protein